MTKPTHTSQALSRRNLLQFSVVAGLATTGLSVMELSGPSPANAAPTSPRVTDLGPGVVQFGSKSAYQFGDMIYIGSGNLEPMYVIAYHVPSRRVTGQTQAPDGRSTQALCADPTGRYLYFGTENAAGNLPTLYRWDLENPTSPAEALGRAGEVRVWALDVAPDGMVFFGGREPGGNLWQFDPASGLITPLGIPVPTATGARAIAATATHVYFGTGNTLGGGQASKAALAAYNRATGTFTSILPPELAGDDTVRELRLDGDRLIVGTVGGASASHVAVIDVANPSSYKVASHDGVTTKAMHVHEDRLYFMAQAGDARVCDLATMEVSPLLTNDVDLGEVWGMGWSDNRLNAVSAYGFVAAIDPTSGTTERTDLISAGAPSEAQLAMSVTAGGGYAYVAANGAIARHSLTGKEVINLVAPGETKDAAWANGKLWMGQYSGLGLWGYDPGKDADPAQMAPLPAQFNRPECVAWDDHNRRVLVAALADANGGSCLGVYNPVSDDILVHEHPLGPGQSVPAVTCRDGIAYIGGGTGGTGPAGEIAAIAPMTGTVLWRLDPQHTAPVTGMAVRGRHLYVALNDGALRVIDIPRRRIVHSADISDAASKRSNLVTANGRVYGVSSKAVYEIDPKTFELTTLLADVNGAWYGGQPHISADEHGDLYTMRERNLIRIETA
ncbi:PQQ-binding-like beta-propeller repeat protein [Paenarthrobacter nitroguajacolicus]|uniref:outer membrane protein assembly factor BamB family protein n=1 Tax=Paenarthrobacter nitroguajacolicus TaxID=211146 RepID=UPI003AD99CD9